MAEVAKQERRGSALILTIDRPEAGNSLSADVFESFIEILDGAEGDTTSARSSSRVPGTGSSAPGAT